MFCRTCGEQIPIDSVYCPSCGKNLIEIAIPAPERDEETAPATPSEPPQKETLGGLRTSLAEARRKARIAARGSSRVTFSWTSTLTWHRIFFGMGLAFSIVGFVLGTVGRQQAIDWLLFGLILVGSAFYTRPIGHPSQDVPKPEPAPSEGDDTTTTRDLASEERND